MRRWVRAAASFRRRLQGRPFGGGSVCRTNERVDGFKRAFFSRLGIIVHADILPVEEKQRVRQPWEAACRLASRSPFSIIIFRGGRGAVLENATDKE